MKNGLKWLDKSRIILIGYIITSVCVLVLGISYHLSHKKNLQAKIEDELKSITELKTSQIAQWYKERLSEVVYFSNVESLIENTTELISGNLNKRESLKKILTHILSNQRYENIFILNTNGSILFTLDSTFTTIDSTVVGLNKKVIRTNEILFSDLYKCSTHNKIHADFIAPIRNKSNIVIATLVFRINPDDYLFPLIQKWPIYSKTAETVLVRRDNDSVVIINEVRHKKATALNIKFPITRVNVPAVRAVLGTYGIFEGYDYRHKRVLTYSTPIENTSWILISKVDTEEVYMPIKKQARGSVAILVLFLTLLGALLIIIRISDKRKHYKKLFELEVERKVLISHFEHLVKYANDIILLVNSTGQIIEANDSALKSYQYNRDEIKLIELSMLGDFNFKPNLDNDRLINEIISQTPYEALHNRRNGEQFPVEISEKIIEIDDSRYYQAIIRDISERKQAERELAASEAKFRSFFENSMDSIMITVPDGRILYANPASCKLFGYTEAEIGKLGRDGLVDKSDPNLEILLKERSETGKAVGELTMIKKDGTKFPVEVASAIFYQGSDVLRTSMVIRDISGRKRTEEELLVMAKRLELATKSAGIGIWDWNIIDNELIWDDQMHYLYGIKKDKFKGAYDSWLEGIHPDDRTYSDEVSRQALAGEKEYDTEFRIIWPDRSIHFIKAIGNVFRDTKGNPTRMIGVNFDITKRKLTEEALKQSEETHKVLFNHNPIPMWVYDLRTLRFLSVNETACSKYGYSRDEFLKMTLKDIRPTEDVDLLLANISNSKYQVIQQSGAWRHKLKNGEIIYVDIHSHSIIYEGVDARIVAIYDITEKRKAEIELQKSEERFRSIFENSTIGIYRTTPDGEILMCNPALVKMLGFESFKEISNRDVSSDGYAPGYDRSTFLHQIETEGQVIGLEAGWKRKDGDIIFVRENAKVFRDKDGNTLYYEGTAEDITEKKLHEQEKEISIKILNAINSTNNIHDLIKEATLLLQKWLNCDAIGVRLKDGDDYPYYETRGFPSNFVKMENHLCHYDDDGNVIRDGDLNPKLDCMCGSIIQGRFDPNKPFFTKGGSFWSNNTTRLLSTTTEKDRQGSTRNRCNGEGYESVALIPLRTCDATFGLMQFNSLEKNKFTESKIFLLERLATSLALSIAQHQAVLETKKSEERYHSLFDNMLNGFAYCQMYYHNGEPTDFRYLDVNNAFEKLTGLKNVRGKLVTEVIPGIRENDPKLFELYSRVALSGAPDAFEIFVESLNDWFSVTVYSPKKEFFIVIFDVITERKRSEEALQKNLERFRSTLDNMIEGCQIIDLDWKYIYINKSAEIQNRRPSSELLGNTYVEMWPDIESTLVYSLMKNCMAERVAHHFNNEFIFPDGYTGWYELSIQPVPEGIFILSVDITDRRKAEIGLNETYKRLLEAQQLAHIGNWEWDLQKQTLIWSNEMYRIFGYNPDEFSPTAEAFEKRIHPDDINDFLNQKTKMIEEKQPASIDHRVILPGGQIRYIQERAHPILGNDQNVSKVIGTAQDITERKKSQLEIVQLNNQLQHLIMVIQELAKANNLEIIMKSVRSAARNLIGADGATFILREDKNCFYADEDAITPLWKGLRFPLENSISGWAMLNKQTVVIEDIYLDSRIPHDAYRNTFVKSLAMVPINTTEPRGAIGIYWANKYTPKQDEIILIQTLADATSIALDNIRVYEELEQRVEQRTHLLELANMELEAYSYTVSHDLRAPLRAIHGFIQIFNEEYAKNLDDEGIRIMAIIQNNSIRMGNLIDDLLTFSRISRTGILKVTINTNTLVQEVYQELTIQNRKSNVKFSVSDLPQIYGDKNLIRQVWTNLISNAIKYTSKVEKPDIEIGYTEKDNNYEFYVKDNGVGFDMNYVGKLFGVFQRLHSDKEFEGTGVGLAIVQRIINRHNGTVRAVGEINNGATIYFTLPKNQ